MDLNFYNDFCNAILNLEIGWTNWFWCNDNICKLKQWEKQAFTYKREFAKNGINLKDLYKQIADFEKKAASQKTLTKEPQEAIILTAVEYAMQGRPIIFSMANKGATKSPYNTTQDKIKQTYRYQYDVFKDLISFYYQNRNDDLCRKALSDRIYNFLDFDEAIYRIYPDENFYIGCYYATVYLKILIKEKKYNEAEDLLKKYKLRPRSEKEGADLQKIKDKILLKQIKG